jgi:3-phenylpropionate/cinnamic acid dioxygenase small subunit
VTATSVTGVDLATRVAVEDFYYREAEVLDERRWDEWLAMLAPDIEYTAPIRVVRRRPAPDVIDDLGHFDDTYASLALRVKRLQTDVAWCEDPPSMTRRMVSNVRVRPGEAPGELAVRTNLLIFRSRGDMGTHDLLAGERQDLLSAGGADWVIRRRRTLLDQASLGTKNLGIFL